MRELLVAKDTVTYALSTSGGKIAGSWEADKLTDGSFAVFNKDGSLVDDIAPIFTDTEIYFGKGKVGNGTEVFAHINLKNLKYNKQVYIAPVNSIICYGDTPANAHLVFPTVVAGQVYGFTITDKTLPVEKTNRVQTYTYTAITGDTQATIMAKVVLAVNVTNNTVCTCAVLGATQGFSFTGQTTGKYFAVEPAYDMLTLVSGMLIESANTAGTAAEINGVYYSATTTITLTTIYGNGGTLVTPVMGVVPEGDAASLKVTENDYSTEKGNINALWMLNALWTKPSDIVSGATYTMHTLTWSNVPESGNVPTRDNNYEQMLLTAIPSANTNGLITSLDNILAAI